jgi:hypothetical protein
MNINNFFRKYFRDSYGFDKLSQYLALTGLLFTLSGRSSSKILGLVFVGVSLWRAISKNKYKRYQELAGFNNLLSVIGIKFNKYKIQASDTLKFKVLKCPDCSQKLRVPRGKGKIVITCKKCRKEFKARS